jgi:hypothetical protein
VRSWEGEQDRERRGYGREERRQGGSYPLDQGEVAATISSQGSGDGEQYTELLHCSRKKTIANFANSPLGFGVF